MLYTSNPVTYLHCASEAEEFDKSIPMESMKLLQSFRKRF